jgi:[protein-PII] uridylyltransferase
MSSLPSNIQQLKELYEETFHNLKESFLLKHDSVSFLKKNSQLCDRIIIDIWRQCNINNNFCLVAVGGYGRRELYPSSDIDMAVISANTRELDNNKKELEQFIQYCWDFGFKIGISQRVKTSIKTDIKDITIATNLLEARLIAGNKTLYNEYFVKFNTLLNVKKFILEKIQEQTERNFKYSKSGYLLEPNIKESRGCLRDIHFIRWLCAANFKSHELDSLVKNNILDNSQLTRLKHHFYKLAKRRIYIHIKSEQQEDRMLFDYQSQIAKDLGFVSNDDKKASEIVMNSLYKSIRYITYINEFVTKKINILFTKSRRPIPGFKELIDINGLIEIKPKNKISINRKIFKYFHLYQSSKVYSGFGPSLMQKFYEFSDQSLNASYRKDKEIQIDFIKIFCAKKKVNRSLRLMNRYNILGGYLPVFGKIISQMQHDLFHIYTVDEHTLNVIDNLRRYSKKYLKHEAPESHEVFLKLKNPYILYFAGLFHDIGKGQGGSHSEIGEKEVYKFGRKFNLKNKDTNQIAWLVKSHLRMSNVAQKSDLADPGIIKKFAKEVGNQENLDLLYLLTTADIRGTSFKVWNQWKSSLINGLYQTTSNYLSSKMSEQQVINQRITQVKKRLNGYSIPFSSYKKNWELKGDDYFRKFAPSEITWHTRVLLTHIQSKSSIVRVRHQENGDGLEVLIYTRDKKDIFFKTCKFFNEINCEVVQAKIFTTMHSYALNQFNISYDTNNAIKFNDFFSFIESKLSDVIDKKEDIKIDVKRNMRRSRQAEFHKIENNISIDQYKNHFHLQVKTANRDALLLSIMGILRNHDINILNAKITTMGERVEDHFDFESPVNNFSSTKLQKQLQKLID